MRQWEILIRPENLDDFLETLDNIDGSGWDETRLAIKDGSMVRVFCSPSMEARLVTKLKFSLKEIR